MLIGDCCSSWVFSFLRAGCSHVSTAAEFLGFLPPALLVNPLSFVCFILHEAVISSRGCWTETQRPLCTRKYKYKHAP